jgi:hypothetical protein
MNSTCAIRSGAGFGALLCLASSAAVAQVTTSATTSGTPEPNPYYIGASEAITHDSNVYRIPSGPGDFYSTTSVFGGFDQRISRQRVFGSATVGLNRYRDQSQLDNTSYDLATGLDWETIGNLSGDLDLGLRQLLAAPAASAGQPVAHLNLARTQTLDARARWGGPSLLSVEGDYNRSSLDYSAPEYVSSESTRDSGSLVLYYKPGGPLRLGVGGRVDRTRTPRALFDPVAGTYQSNTVHGRNLDVFADYELSGFFTADARLSYTRQTNSAIDGADFSGITGRIGLKWRPTGRLSFNTYVARDAGFESVFGGNPASPAGGSGGTQAGTFYENNRITNTLDVGGSYSATAKIDASVGARYSHANVLVTSSAPTAGATLPEATDIMKSAYLGVDYAILANWSAACKLAHETRTSSGAVSFSYASTSLGCSTRLVWR